MTNWKDEDALAKVIQEQRYEWLTTNPNPLVSIDYIKAVIEEVELALVKHEIGKRTREDGHDIDTKTRDKNE